MDNLTIILMPCNLISGECISQSEYLRRINERYLDFQAIMDTCNLMRGNSQQKLMKYHELTGHSTLLSEVIF